jgi:hypothetical protein
MSIVDDGQTPDALDVHHAVGLKDGEVRRNRVDRTGHPLRHLEPVERRIPPGHAVEQVLLGEDTDHPPSVHHDDAGDVQLRHLPSDRKDRIVQGGRDDVFAHDIGHAEHFARRTPRAVRGTGRSGGLGVLHVNRQFHGLPPPFDSIFIRPPCRLNSRASIQETTAILSAKQRADLGTKPSSVPVFG